MFFVAKKQGQRLVVDARQAKAWHARPPCAQLTTGSALASLRFEEQAGAGAWHGSTIDLVDSFYQFSVKQFASWFGCRWGRKARDWGVSEVWSEEEVCMIPVEPDQVLYFCFEALPMGWSWAMYFCQDVVAGAVSRVGRSLAGDRFALVLGRDLASDPQTCVGLRGAHVEDAVLLGPSCDRCWSAMAALPHDSWSMCCRSASSRGVALFVSACEPRDVWRFIGRGTVALRTCLGAVRRC